MRHSQGIRRGAVVGLAVTLLALTAMSLVGTDSTRRSAEKVARSASLAEAYGRAHDAVAAEESLERKYRLEPGAEVRQRHQAAGVELQQALVDVRVRGGPDDRRLVDELRLLHADYQAAVATMFTARDAQDQATVIRIDNEETDPTFERIDALVEAATAEHVGAAARAIEDLRRDEARVSLMMTIGFAVGLCMLAALALVVVGHQRAVLRHADASRRQALHDALTGLPNRTLFADRLGQSLLSARRHGTAVAVVLLDLDRFKEVNDALGHRCGDELLRQIAHRVGGVLRASDTLARLSGDEFAVLLPDADEAQAAASAERILSTVHRSFALGDVMVDVEVSVGIAVAPGHAGTAEALLRCADVAMHTAKTSKLGSVSYRPEMDVQDSSRLLLLGDLRRALDATDQLVVHYQPKVSLGSGELCGAEALVRWQHPTRGRLVPPADFIPIAETTGLINSLTRYVLRLAVRQVRDWLDRGVRIPVAVNLSPRCLLDASMVTHVTALLDEFALPPDLLRLEVTETAVMANPALALSILNRLHELGVRLSIDDYGTGYSSMAYLKRLPVDELKVDRSFVQDMTGDEDDGVLVRSAIDLGHNLGLTVVAEGVETAAQVAALHQLGCDVAQGYYYARPMPAGDLFSWLADRRDRHSGEPVPRHPR